MLGADGLGRYQQGGYAAVRHRAIKGATCDELGGVRRECVTAGWTEIDAAVRVEKDQAATPESESGKSRDVRISWRARRGGRGDGGVWQLDVKQVL